MRTWNRILIRTLFGAALLVSSYRDEVIAQITAADIRTAKQKYLEELLRRSDMSRRIKECLATAPGAGWGDDDPTEWYIAADLTRAMAGDNSIEVETRLRQALDYAEGNPPYENQRHDLPNWWQIQIGVPRALAQGLLLGGQAVPSDLEERMRNALIEFVKQQRVDEKQGANAFWWAWTKLLAAFYLEDEAWAKNAYDMMSTITSQGRHNHITDDWSYFFHYEVLNMHYGGQHFGDFVNFLKISEGSNFSLQSRVNSDDDLQRTGLEICMAWLENFLQWIYYKDGLADPFTVSKFPHWQSSYGERIKRGSSLLAQTSYGEVARYRGVLQKIAAGSALPIGARAFPQSRYLVARRNNFYSSLIMVNLAEPHMEASTFAPIFGAVNIVDPSSYQKWEEDNILKQPFLLMNAMTVPVAYEDATYELSPQGHSEREHEYEIIKMIKNWGYYGVSTLAGYYGMGAEWLTGQDNEFSFRRSWFFLDDEVVCLGSGINSNKAELDGIRTILYNFTKEAGTVRSSQGEKAVPFAQGSDVDLGHLSWLQQKGMGYYFPAPLNVRAQGLGATSRIYLNHGKLPSDVSFAAVLLPTFDQDQTRNYASTPSVEVMQCDRTAHMIHHKTSNVTGIAAFEPIDEPALTTNLPGYVLYQNAGGKFSLSLYNPFREENLTRNLGDKGVNPMFDAEIEAGNETFRVYKLQVPYRLRRGTGSGMKLFDVKYISNERSEVQVPLRVYRKFEMAGDTNPDGSVTINKAWIAWNDAALEEKTTTTSLVDLPPVAVPGGPYVIRVGESLTVDGSRSYDPDGGDISNYQWSFGDGATATGASVSHQFAAAGAYAARLEVTDDESVRSGISFMITIQPQPSAGENIRLLISGDDRYELYINGARIGSNASWQTAEEYTVPLSNDKNVIAVKAENLDQAGALLAEVHARNMFWPSDSKWKVSVAEEKGWQEVDFDDSHWTAATSHGLHGVAQPWAQFQNVSGIATDKGVHWIWSADKRQDHVVYLRFMLPRGGDLQPPATPTSLRALSQ